MKRTRAALLAATGLATSAVLVALAPTPRISRYDAPGSQDLFLADSVLNGDHFQPSLARSVGLGPVPSPP
jgi:hypothetical protein